MVFYIWRLSTSAQILSDGKQAYDRNCASCHGEDGSGYGPEAAGLDPPPQDLTDPAFHEARTDGEMMWVLRHGISGTSMAASVGKGLTEEEGWAVIRYIRSLRAVGGVGP